MGLFDREGTCEKCGGTFPKKQLFEFDASCQGENIAGEKRKVCGQCLMTLFLESLRAYEGRAVIVAPMRRYNAYDFYSFDTLLAAKETRSAAEMNEALVNDLRGLLPPPDTECALCSNEARYTWCPPAVLLNDPFQWEANPKKCPEPLYLCPECLYREFRKKVQEDEIHLDCIMPPHHGPGFMCSWEY